MNESREKNAIYFYPMPNIVFSFAEFTFVDFDDLSRAPIFSEREYQSTIVERERFPASSMAWVCGRCRTKSQVTCKIISSVKFGLSNHVPIRTPCCIWNSATDRGLRLFCGLFQGEKCASSVDGTMDTNAFLPPTSLRPQEDAVVLRSYFVAMVVQAKRSLRGSR